MILGFLSSTDFTLLIILIRRNMPKQMVSTNIFHTISQDDKSVSYLSIFGAEIDAFHKVDHLSDGPTSDLNGARSAGISSAG